MALSNGSFITSPSLMSTSCVECRYTHTHTHTHSSPLSWHVGLLIVIQMANSSCSQWRLQRARELHVCRYPNKQRPVSLPQTCIPTTWSTITSRPKGLCVCACGYCA